MEKLLRQHTAYLHELQERVYELSEAIKFVQTK